MVDSSVKVRLGGDFYVYSQIADITYKRLAHTINVPAGGATMSFWTSYDTEADWDHVFVEAHTVGQDNWTTLPDLNGHTTQATGESCKQENSGGWRTLHPHLDHYQTQTGPSTCDPTGTTGAWHTASGSSGGWQQWTVDLGGFAGQQVEVSHLLRKRLGVPGPGHLHRRHRGIDRGGNHLLRNRDGRMDHSRCPFREFVQHE